MREIKFRAWHDSASQMIYQPPLEWSFGEIKCLSYDDNGSSTTLTIMQFTGLQDKNGKDIYDGDIVAFCDDERHEVAQADSGEWALVPWCDNLYEHSDELVIVGNKFESPDLLGA